MKCLINATLIMLSSFILGLFLPWWSFAAAAFLMAAVIRQRHFPAFLSGFSSLFILWGGLAWWADARNNHLLSQKVAAILPLGGSSFLLLLTTALIAGIVAGLASLTGSYLFELK